MYKSGKSYHWIYFYIQPFFTLAYYLINYRKAAAKNVVWAFTVFFAMTIAIGEESQNSDIVRYMADLKMMSKLDFTFASLINYYLQSGEIDIFRIFSSYIISKFTENGYLLIILYGFVYGYFYSRNIWFVLNQVQGRLKLVSLVLLICLFLLCPIWNLGGFRFWTATHVFFFGLLPFLITRKKKSLTWCLLTPFIFHYAFIIPLLILLLFVILGNRLKLYFYFFVASLVIGEINISQFNNLVETYAPNVFVERSDSYRLEEQVESFRTGEYKADVVWYARYLNKFIHWPLYAFLLLVYVKSQTLFKSNSNLLRLLCFTLFFYGFANLFSTLPSGARYLTLAGMLATSFLLIFLQINNQEKIFSRAIKMALPFLVIFVIVQIRMSWYFVSLVTLIGNPLIAIFHIGQNISINDIIK